VAAQSEIDEIISQVVARVAQVEGIAAIVLGGSRARGTADERSDIDLGIYYDAERSFSIAALEAAAQELDDRHAEGLVTPFGAWGPAVNGGGWLEIRGHHVDFLYREIGAVREAIEDFVAGRPRSVYQLGHPLGFHMQIYAGEVHVCRPLFTASQTIAELKSMVCEYPEKFRTAAVTKHLFDAEFEISICAKPVERVDVMYVAGCLFRAAARQFAIKPARFHDTVAGVLGNVGTTSAELAASVASFQRLAAELRQLAANEGAL
jgi:predicted nucleotidyltransferase